MQSIFTFLWFGGKKFCTAVFSLSRIELRNWNAFDCYVSSVSFNLEHSCMMFYLLWHWYFWKAHKVFCRKSFYLYLSDGFLMIMSWLSIIAKILYRWYWFFLLFAFLSYVTLLAWMFFHFHFIIANPIFPSVHFRKLLCDPCTVPGDLDIWRKEKSLLLGQPYQPHPPRNRLTLLNSDLIFPEFL